MRARVEALLDQFAAGRIDRREATTALAAIAWSLAASRPSHGYDSPFRATGLNHLAVRVSDVARSRDFYRETLGLSVLIDNDPGNCFLRAGEHYFGLFRSAQPGLDHFCFTVDGYDPDGAMETLESLGLEGRRREDRVYFDDPDGLEVQLDSRYGSWPGPRPADA